MARDVSAMPAAGRQVHVGRAVEENLVVEHDAAGGGSGEAGDRIEDESLARAGRSE
jgi:hypothetical protein